MAKRPSAPVAERFLSDGHRATIAVLIALALVLLSLPFFAHLSQEYRPPELGLTPFPVSVDPETQTIIENPETEAMFFENQDLAGAVLYAGDILDTLASYIAQTPAYDLLGLAGGPHFVVIDPGYRKEQVSHAFGEALNWDQESEDAFLALREEEKPALNDGNFSPGIYVVKEDATEAEAHALIDARFERQILSRYSTTTAEKIPLEDALTMASIIQRETADREEMRVISGILWNRIFEGMRLQVDATLQYAKANAAKPTAINKWWPRVVPDDKFIKSPYNTYLNEGLPPAPISNPSVAAVIAALNPKKTDCFFYFHDRLGGFHCSPDYEGHVALLKKHFGQGR